MTATFSCCVLLLSSVSINLHAQSAAEGPIPTLDAGAKKATASAAPRPFDQLPAELAAAKTLLDQGKLREADQATREYMKIHSNSAEGHFLRGYILFREAQAQGQITKSGQPGAYRDPSIAETVPSLQEAAVKASLDEFTEGAKYNKPTAFDLKVVALDYILMNDYPDADKWLTQSLRANPNDADGWYLMGRTKYNENRFDEAAQSFEFLLKLEPKSVKAADNLGLSYAGLGQTEKAVAAYQNAMAWQAEAAAKDPGPYLDLGILLLEQNRAQDAVPYLTQAVNIAPNESRHHEELGQAFTRLEDFPKAQEELEAAVRLAPQNARLHYLLARVYSKEGLTEKANSEFARSESLKAEQTARPTLAPPKP